MTAGDVEVIKGTINSHLAASFDGTDDELQINAAAVAAQTAASSTGTIAFWFMPDNITGTYGLIAFGAAVGAASETLLIQQAVNDIRVYGRTQAAAGFDIITTAAALEARTWVHVCVVKTEVRPNIYINGSLVTMTDTVSTDLTDWFAEFANLDEGRIGCRTLNGAEDQFLLGVMGPTKLWNVALTATEVAREAGIDSSSNETAQQTILDAALQNYWGWDGVLTDAGTGADTAVVVGHAYLSGWTSEWSRLIETRGYTNAADQFNTFRDGPQYVTIAIQGA